MAAWLVVRVGDEERAVATETLRAVLPSPPVTRVPFAPPRVRGLVAWRGQVVALVADHDGATQGAYAAVVLEAGDELLALAVDGVVGFADERGERAVVDPKALRSAAAQG